MLGLIVCQCRVWEGIKSPTETVSFNQHESMLSLCATAECNWVFFPQAVMIIDSPLACRVHSVDSKRRLRDSYPKASAERQPITSCNYSLCVTNLTYISPFLFYKSLSLFRKLFSKMHKRNDFQNCSRNAHFWNIIYSNLIRNSLSRR